MSAIDKILACGNNDTCQSDNDSLDAHLGRAQSVQNQPENIKLAAEWGGSRSGSGRPLGSPNKPKQRIIQRQPAGPRWYVIETMRGREKRVVRDLLEGEDRRGYIQRPPYEVYLPTRATEVVLRGVRQTIHEVQFKGYLFASFDRETDHWAPICHVEDVLRLFMTRSLNPIPLPVGFVEMLVQEAPERLKLPSVRMPSFALGQDLRIETGAMATFPARCLSCDGLTTRVSVQVFGRDVEVVLARSSLAPV